MSEAGALVRRLESTGTVTSEERTALQALTGDIRLVFRGVDVVRAGERATHCCILLSGLLYRYGINHNGRRQIMSLHLPGDIPDLQSLFLPHIDHALASSTVSRVMFVAHSDIKDAMAATPTIIPLLWRETLIDGAAARARLLALGQSPARSRLAHLFCELIVRQRATQPARDLPLPITQAELADALGMSDVHVNRTLQELRGEKMIEFDDQQLHIPNWSALKRVAQFDAGFLHLRDKTLAD